MFVSQMISPTTVTAQRTAVGSHQVQNVNFLTADPADIATWSSRSVPETSYMGTDGITPVAGTS